MNQILPHWPVRLLACGLALVLAAPGSAAESTFSFARNVPDDLYMFAAGRTNPEREFLDEYWTDVLDTAKQAGIGDDVMDLLGLFFSEGDLNEVTRLKDHMMTLIDGVDWKKLTAQESAFGLRMAQPTSNGGGINMGPPEIVWLFRSGGAAQANFDGLANLLNGFVSEVNTAANKQVFTVQDGERKGVKTVSVNLLASIPDAPPYAFTVALRGDVICITAGDRIFDEVMALLAGSGGKSLGDDPRFQKAFSMLPPPEDAIQFFDMQAMLKPIRKIFDMVVESKKQTAHAGTDMPANMGLMASQGAPPAAPMTESQKVEAIKRVADRVLNVPGIVDYTATVHMTDGYSTKSESVCALVPGAASMPFYKVFANRKPSAEFGKYLPKETLSFWVSGGIDFTELYKFIEETIQQAPGGDEILAQWGEVQQQVGFNLRDDVLSWIEGGMQTFALDGASAGALMIKVRDEAVARQKMTAGLDFITARMSELAEQAPMLAMMSIRRVPVTDPRLEGFESLYIGMNPQPVVWGVAQGHLFLGTPASAIADCLDTAAGKHPDISKNPRAMHEALMPEGQFTSASLTDQRLLGQQLTAGVGMVSMMTGFMTMAIPDETARQAVGKLASILGKLTPALAKIDFFKSTASQSTFDGKVWHTRSVTHYVSPKERAAPARL